MKKVTIIWMIDAVISVLTIAITILICVFIAGHVNSAYAGIDCYADAGIMVHDNGDSWHEVDYRYDRVIAQDIINPIGMVEGGCRRNRVTLFLYHSTSVQMQDSGINAAGVKYRLFGK